MGARGRHGFAVGALVSSQAASAFGAPEPAEHDSARRDADSGQLEASRVGVVLSPTLAVADNCSRDSDVVMCQSARVFLAFEGSLQLPLLPELGVGPFLRLGFEGGGRGSGGTTSSGAAGSSSSSSQFGAAGAELRLLPFAPVSFWLGARAGFLGVRDVTRVEAAGESEAFESYAWAPSVGGDVGFDVGLDDGYGLSFMLSVDYVMLSSDSDIPEQNAVNWYSGPWVGLGLGMFFDV